MTISAAATSARPARPVVVVPRPGPARRLGEAFGRAPVVQVVAGVGHGKTTAAMLHADAHPDTVDWLTLTATTTAEALQVELDGIGGPGLLVVDDAEHAVAPALAPVLAAFLDRLPDGVEVLLLTTTHLGPVTDELVLSGRCEVIGADGLRLDEADAERLVAAVRRDCPLAAHDVVRQSGGWIAGAVLLARLAGEPGEPPSPVLVSYVETRIVGVLAPDEQDLLLAASLLGRLSRDDVAGLLGAHTESVFYRLRARNLPMVAITADGLVFAGLLTACLREILPRHQSASLPGLRRRFALHLAMAGRFDEAVDWCMRAGEPALAVEVLEAGLRTLPDLAAVSDQVGRWLRVIGEPHLLASDVLTACLIRAYHAERHIDQAVALIHRLEADGRMDDIVAVDPSVVGVVLWSLHSRPTEAEHYAADSRDGHRADAVRFMLAATSGTEPAIPPLTTRWMDMTPVVHWGMLWQGRLDEVLTAVGSPDADDNCNVVLAALWSGHRTIAEEAWELIPPLRRARPHAVFTRAALEIARGDLATGLRMLRGGADSARHTEVLNHFEILASFATLQKGSPIEAVAALRPGLVEMDGVERRAITEWARLVLGLGLLELDRPREAYEVLVPAVESMRRARRHLMLAAASYAQAESELRLGDAVSAGATVAEARRQAGRSGSTYWAEQALLRCPRLRDSGILDPAPAPSADAPDPTAVASRSADRQPERVELRPFHEPPVVVIDGVESSARRMKVVELIADLSLHPEGIERTRLQERLFPEVGRSRGGNHFRQITFRLRELAGVKLERRDPSLVVWPAEVELVTADRAFEEAALRQRDLTDPSPADMAQLRAAVDLAPGVYLPGSDLAWVEQRRVYLSVLYEEAVTALLWWAVEAGDVDMVRRYGARALECNPFSEETYELLMRAEHLGGNRAGAMAVYRRALTALGELGLEPGADLRRLAQGSQGSGPVPRSAARGRVAR